MIKNVLREPSLQFQNGQLGIGFTAVTDRRGTSEVFLNTVNCMNISVLSTHLANKSIMINPDPKAKDMIVKFATSWLDKLRLEDDAIGDAGTMGWRYRDGNKCGFVYGDVLYRDDGTEVPLITSTTTNSAAGTPHRGIGSPGFGLASC